MLRESQRVKLNTRHDVTAHPLTGVATFDFMRNPHIHAHTTKYTVPVTKVVSDRLKQLFNYTASSLSHSRPVFFRILLARSQHVRVVWVGDSFRSGEDGMELAARLSHVQTSADPIQ